MKTINKKRILSLILALSMALSSNMMAFAATPTEEYVSSEATEVEPYSYSTTLNLSGTANAFGTSGHITIPAGYTGLYAQVQCEGYMVLTFWNASLGIEKSFNVSKSTPSIPERLGNSLPAGDYDVLVSFSNTAIGHPYSLKIYSR